MVLNASKVLVTGANGFIGQYAVQMLVDSGFEVHGICWNNQPELAGEVIWHQIDLMCQDSVDQLLEKLGATHLLHLAWYTEHGKFWQATENLDWVKASLGLLASFIKNGGKRITMAGSCAEYDWSEGHCSEKSTTLNPGTLYGVSKHALQQLASHYSSLNNVSFAWGRVFFLYGPGEYSGRFVPSVINGLLTGKSVACSDGNQLRDFMHVSDVASAFVKLLSSNIEGAVNIASGEAVTLRDIGEQLLELTGGNGQIEFGALPARKEDPEVITADVNRLHTELGWRPSFNLKEGLADTLEWWKTQPEVSS
jgi:nucleoside-diphosphate-sugar epimerase